MTYRILANLVVIVHFAFVIFVVLGALLVLRWPKMMWPHLLAAAWGALIEFGGWICPLTPLENWLRRQGGAQGYEGDFVTHYLLPILYPTGLTREIQIVLGLLVIVINALLYALLWRRR